MMCQALSKLGHMVTQFSLSKVRQGISPFKTDDHLKHKKPYSLRTAIHGYENKVDVMIVAQSFLFFNNDVDVPVVYWHTELTSPPTVGTYDPRHAPTHLAMKVPEIDRFFRSYFSWWYECVKHKFYLWPAAHPMHYNPEHKKDVHFSFVGAPTNMFDRERDWIWNIMQEDHNEIRAFFKLHHLGEFCDEAGEVPADHPFYNDLLARSEFMLLTGHKGVYIGRRPIECLASKTIPVIWIENDYAERVYRELGFENNGEKKNCFFFRKKEELLNLNLEYDKKVAQNGYDLFIDNHTFLHRGATLIKQLNLTLHRKFFIEPVQDPNALVDVKLDKLPEKEKIKWDKIAAKIPQIQ